MKKQPKLIDFMEEVLEKFDLNHGNGEVYQETETRILMNIEAPNHTTLMVDVNLDGIFIDMWDVLEEVIKRIQEHDPEETFEEFWCQAFGRRNGFGAFQFVEMLKEDAEYFDEKVEQIKEYRYKLDENKKYENLLID